MRNKITLLVGRPKPAVGKTTLQPSAAGGFGLRAKALIFCVALAALSTFNCQLSTASAQGIAKVREGLSKPATFSGARVVVTEHSDAAEAIATADRNGRQSKVTNYRVGLFRDNSQYAQANARAVVEKFKEIYPDIAVNVEYESPYFTVSAGNFVDHTSAVALCGKVMPTFPKAVVVRGEITVSTLIARQKSNYFPPSTEFSEKNNDN